MEIPKSISNTWEKASADGVINKKEVQDLKDAITGNGILRLDELDENDSNFISNLDISTHESKTGSVLVKNLSFIDDSGKNK